MATPPRFPSKQSRPPIQRRPRGAGLRAVSILGTGGASALLSSVAPVLERSRTGVPLMGKGRESQEGLSNGARWPLAAARPRLKTGALELGVGPAKCGSCGPARGLAALGSRDARQFGTISGVGTGTLAVGHVPAVLPGFASLSLAYLRTDIRRLRCGEGLLRI